MNQWINEPMNQWINESMNQWINESMNQWINESMNQWINESMNHNQLINTPINKSRPVNVAIYQQLQLVPEDLQSSINQSLLKLTQSYKQKKLIKYPKNQSINSFKIS